MKRFVYLVLAVSVCPTLTGCITLFSKAEVVRSKEPLKPMQFESAEVAEDFRKAAKLGDSKVVGATHLGVPFVTLYESKTVLAKNAQLNDAVQKCDTNQDGIITAQEVVVFKKLYPDD